MHSVDLDLANHHKRHESSGNMRAWSCSLRMLEPHTPAGAQSVGITKLVATSPLLSILLPCLLATPSEAELLLPLLTLSPDQTDQLVALVVFLGLWLEVSIILLALLSAQLSTRDPKIVTC